MTRGDWNVWACRDLGTSHVDAHAAEKQAFSDDEIGRLEEPYLPTRSRAWQVRSGSETPYPASVAVSTNGGGYTLTVSRTAFTGGADIPLSLAVTAPGGASSALTGQTAIPSTESLTVGNRPGGQAVTGDEWSPVYQLGPVPLRPAGATSATVTYTAVGT